VRSSRARAASAQHRPAWRRHLFSIYTSSGPMKDVHGINDSYVGGSFIALSEATQYAIAATVEDRRPGPAGE
jgi:hypothetical protein